MSFCRKGELMDPKRMVLVGPIKTVGCIATFEVQLDLSDLHGLSPDLFNVPVKINESYWRCLGIESTRIELGEQIVKIICEPF